MDHSIAPQTRVFKLNCPKCQKKAKKLLSRLNGVYSIKVEGDAGRVTIKSTVHPNTLAAVIGGIMKEQDFSCEPLTPPPNNNVHVEQWINNMPVHAADNCNAHYQSQFKGYEVADLHELARAPRVKQLEFTQTRNIKMIFNDEKEGGPSRPPPEPKKDPGPNHSYACDPSDCHSHIKAQHEPKKGGGPSHSYSGAPGEYHELKNLPHFAEFVVNHSGPCYIPPPYNHTMLPYHGYPPPPYYGRPSPLPPKNNSADLHCDNVSKCRMM